MFRSNRGRRSARVMASRSSIDSSKRKLDWNEQDQMGGTLWPGLMVSEDHIAPCPVESEDSALFPSGDYSTNMKNDVTANVESTEQSSRAKNADLSFESESRSGFHTGEELSSSRTEMDSWWHDFPNLCMELGDDCPDGNSHSSATELMNDLSDASNQNSWRGDSMQLDCEPELVGLDDKQNVDFLDCDWGAFGDFDDIEFLFRKNDAMFGHDMIGSDDGFLSPSNDIINSTAQSIPLPVHELPLCDDQISNEGCSSVQFDGHSEKQQNPLQKGKVDGQNIIRVSENKAEDRRLNSSNYNNLQLTPSTNVHSPVPLQTFQPDLINQQTYDANLMERHGSFNQASLTQRGYPMQCFSAQLLPPHIQIDSNQKGPVSSRTDERAQRVSSSETNMLSENDESIGTSGLTCDSHLKETIYFQLQEVVEKLDMRIRLCIRDSLLRLARSARERQVVREGSRTYKNSNDEGEVSADEELRDLEKSTTLADSETETNPIDRIVANLLFHGTTYACPGTGSYELLGST